MTIRQVWRVTAWMVIAALAGAACKFPYPADVPEPFDAAVDGGAGDASLPEYPVLAFRVGGVGTEALSTSWAIDGDIVVAGEFAGPTNFGGGDRSGPGFVARYNQEGLHRWSLGLPGGAVVGLAAHPTGVFVVLFTFTNWTWPGTTMTFQRTPGAGAELVIAKLDPMTGALIWAVRPGGVSDQSFHDMAVAANGDVVLMGKFGQGERTIVFGQSSYAAVGIYDVFVARLAATNGAAVWSRHFPGSAGASTSGAGIDIDAMGDPVVTGKFQNSISIGPSPLMGGGTFVAKLAGTDGRTKWDTSYGVNATDLVAYGGNVLLTGTLTGTVTLGSTSLTPTGSSDLFLASLLGGDGAATWARSWRSAADTERAQAVAVTANGEVALAGDFSGTATFDTEMLTSAGQTDIFVVRCAIADMCATSRVRRFGASEADVVKSVRPSSATKVDIGGTFRGTVDFGVRSLTSAGYEDVFVFRSAF